MHKTASAIFEKTIDAGRFSMKCNLCGSDEFVDMNSRPNVRCKECGSLERTRLIWLYLSRMEMDENFRALHIAPEKGLYDALSARLAPGNYDVADINPKLYRFAKQIQPIDLCNLDDQPSERYDLILHSHVLEHTPCNIAYTLCHLHRMLTPRGRHVFVVPFMKGRYDECFQDIGDDERVRRFGQDDHVRRFGRDDLDDHLGKIVKLPETFDATFNFNAADLLEANIPEPHWVGFTSSTVIFLRKNDVKLSASDALD